jgi:hypothetical protein
MTIFVGCIAGIACLGINLELLERFSIEFSFYSKYVAPVIEELLKAVYIIFLIKTHKVGFMIDGAIYGFAIGAGFAIVENAFALYSMQNPNLLLWVIRGFGTAVMHGGTTCIFAILARKSTETRKGKIISFMPGLLLAILLHSFFNHFFLNPILMTVGQLILLPSLISFVFIRSENNLKDWLEVGMDTDVSLMEYILSGNIAETKIGHYLKSLKEKFPGEVMADFICYLRIHLELSIRAKGFLLMQGAGFNVNQNPKLQAQLKELKYLEKSIGKTGKLALAPLLHTSSRELWQIYFVHKK